MDKSITSEASDRIKVKKPTWSKITYRVQLPNDCERDDLSRIIQTLFNINAAEFKIHSLSLDISEVAGLSRKVATVSFRDLPADLRDGQDWWFDIPTTNEESSPGRICFDSHFKGFTPLTPAENDSNCDINCIFLHGWGGHAIGSFTWPGTTYSWMRDDLCKRFQKLRIWTYGYGSKMNDVNSVSNAHDLGKGLAIGLRDFRHNAVDKQNPVIFVAHSLGGLLLQEALLSMSKSRFGSDDQLNLQLIRGALFFGVPGQGMDVAALASMIEGLSNQYTSTLLNKDVGWYRRDDQEDAFSRIFPDSSLRLIQFYETRKTPEKGWDGKGWIETNKFSLLVEPKSATSRRRAPDDEDDTIPLDKNHLDMVKFAENDIHDYRKVCNALGLLTSDAHTIIHKRFQQQRLKEEKVSAEKIVPGNKEYLESLEYDEMFDREHNVSKAEVATCSWLLSYPSYLQWLNDSCGIFWIKGKPGAGKSTLLKHAYNTAQEHATENDLIASFFFHGRGSQLQKSLTGLYRSLLHQIIQNLPGIRRSLGRGAEPFDFDKVQDRAASERQEQELADTFEKCLLKAALVRSLRIYVDALDECGVEAAIKLIEIFRRVLGKSRVNRGTIKVCFSCRHYPEIDIDDGADVIVEKQNSIDIQKYVDTQLARLKGYTSDEDLLRRFQEKSNGVFQWTVFVVSQIVSSSRFGFDTKIVEQKINDLPSDLYKLYESVLMTESLHDKQQSLLLFQWTVLAQNPLSLQNALPIIFDREDFDPRFNLPFNDLTRMSNFRGTKYCNPDVYSKIVSRICNVSKGLIEIVEGYSSRTLQIIHHSVKDYLLNGGFCFLGASLSTEGYSHFALAQSCLEYLNIQEIRSELLGELSLDTDSLLKDPIEKLSSTKYAICLDMVSGDVTNRVQQEYRQINSRYEDSSRSRFYVTEYMWKRLRDDSIEKQEPNPTEPVSIEWGENGQMIVSDVYTAYILIQSSTKKISKATREMLSTWAFYRIAWRFPFFHLAATEWIYHIRLAQASCSEQYDWKNFNVNLDRAADILSTHFTINNHIREGEQDYIRLEYTCEKKQSPWTSTNLVRRTGLQIAAAQGLTYSTLWFCKENYPVNAKDCYGQTALHLALSYGHKDVAGILRNLERIDLFTTDADGNTLLHAATIGRLASVLSDLLACGLSVDERNVMLQTPLHKAAYWNDLPSMTVLLDAGADIAVEDSRDETPCDVMMYMHSYGWETFYGSNDEGKLNVNSHLQDSLRFLVARGVNTSRLGRRRTLWGPSLLYLALQHSFFDTAELLLEGGASIDEADYRANLLLRFLESMLEIFGSPRSSANLSKVLEFLLLHGADINRTLSDGSGVLLLSTRLKYNRDVQGSMLLLLSHGANPNVKSKEGATVLYAAAHRFFRKDKPEGSFQRADRKESFQWADRKELLTSLIKHGADVTVRDTSYYHDLDTNDISNQSDEKSDGKEAFSLIVSQAKDFLVDVEITQLSLDKNQAITMEDTYVAGIYLDIVTLFLDAGAIINPDESKYQDLFLVARKYARIDLVDRITKQSEAERSKQALMLESGSLSTGPAETSVVAQAEINPIHPDTRKRQREVEFDELPDHSPRSTRRRRRSI